MATKAEIVAGIVQELASESRKTVIAAIIERAGMTPAGASTYYYNATKKLGIAPVRSQRKQKSAKARGPATSSVQSVEQPAKLTVPSPIEGINIYTMSILPSDHKIDTTYGRFADRAVASAVLEHEALLASGMLLEQ